MNRLDRQRHSFGNATTRRTQANRPDRAYGHQVPSRPGQLVEIDSTPLDVLVLYPDGGSGRVDLTIALDIATRTILAAVLSPVAAKAVDAALMLARAMTPPPGAAGLGGRGPLQPQPAARRGCWRSRRCWPSSCGSGRWCRSSR